MELSKWTKLIVNPELFIVKMRDDPQITDRFITKRIVDTLNYKGVFSIKRSDNTFFTLCDLDKISEICASTYTGGPVMGIFDVIEVKTGRSYDFMYSESQGIVF